MRRLFAAILMVVAGLTAPAHHADPGVTKVLLIVEENSPAAAAFKAMPYLASLAQTYGQATRYTAVAHPSLPNYLDLTSGSTHGVTKDGLPKTYPIHGADVFDDALANGLTAHVYADEEQTPCQPTAGTGPSHYVPRHTAWPYYVDHTAACKAGDTGLDQLQGDIDAGNLPNVGELIPAIDHDGHKPYTLSAADQWLRAELPAILAGPDYTSGRLAVVITFDEGAGSNQTVPLVVIHPSLSHAVVTDPLTHRSTWLWLERVAGVPISGQDTGQEFGL